MKENTFIKISAAIFILLAVIISLFPPFEFGNEKLKTISERRINSDIADKLPVKKYDFILGSNKKYIFLKYNYYTTLKFYHRDSLNYYKSLWGDDKFIFDNSSVDSFSIAKSSKFDPTTAKPWDFDWFDSGKVTTANPQDTIVRYEYDLYNIYQPKYYLLERKLLLGEILIECIF